MSARSHSEDQAKPDPIDGLPAMPVGPWAEDKHSLLSLYVEISKGVRRKFLGEDKAGATYIDLYCATGRCYIRETDHFIDGSPLVAWKASAVGLVAFSAVHLNDLDLNHLEAARVRLSHLGAPVHTYGGDVETAIDKVIQNLDRFALHFAFLDPFKLHLPFEILRKLSALMRIDILIHVSVMDLQRNWKSYVARQESPLDVFAPGWRSAVDIRQSEENARRDFIAYWIDQLKNLGFSGEVKFQLITGSKNQPLYWLVLIAKHEIATKFWKAAVAHRKTGSLFDD